MTEFGSLNHSPGKSVLNNMKTICLRFWKVVVQRVAVIKLRVNNRCGNGTSCVLQLSVAYVTGMFQLSK